MAYEHETEEALGALHAMTELDRVSGPRIAGGIYITGEVNDGND